MWGNTFRTALLDHIARGGPNPRVDTGYIRLLGTDGAEVSTAQWANYEPLTIDMSAANSVFAPAADPGDGSREAATVEAITFQNAPELTGGPLAIRWAEIATAASGGMVMGRYRMQVGGNHDLIVQHGMPVLIPAGMLALMFLGEGV